MHTRIDNTISVKYHVAVLLFTLALLVCGLCRHLLPIDPCIAYILVPVVVPRLVLYPGMVVLQFRYQGSSVILEIVLQSSSRELVRLDW